MKNHLIKMNLKTPISSGSKFKSGLINIDFNPNSILILSLIKKKIDFINFKSRSNQSLFARFLDTVILDRARQYAVEHLSNGSFFIFATNMI